jgi:hypothetical protein
VRGALGPLFPLRGPDALSLPEHEKLGEKDVVAGEGVLHPHQATSLYPLWLWGKLSHELREPKEWFLQAGVVLVRGKLAH